MPVSAGEHRPGRLGVIGWPVFHSRSPAMQNAAIAALGLSGFSYQHVPAPPERGDGGVLYRGRATVEDRPADHAEAAGAVLAAAHGHLVGARPPFAARATL